VVWLLVALQLGIGDALGLDLIGTGDMLDLASLGMIGGFWLYGAVFGVCAHVPCFDGGSGAMLQGGGKLGPGAGGFSGRYQLKSCITLGSIRF